MQPVIITWRRQKIIIIVHTKLDISWEHTLINFTYVIFVLLKISNNKKVCEYFFCTWSWESSKNVEGDKEEIAMIRYGIFFGEKNHLSPYNHLGSGPKKKWLKINIHFFLSNVWSSRFLEGWLLDFVRPISVRESLKFGFAKFGPGSSKFRLKT